MLIKYKAQDRSGNTINGTLEAGSAEIAEDILWERDLIVVVVKGKCQGELSSDFVSGAILLWKDRRRFKVL